MRVGTRAGMVLTIVLCAATGVAAGPASAPSPDGLWDRVSEQTIQGRPGGLRVLFPRQYRMFALNMAALRRLLNDAPREFTPGAAHLAPVIALPMPDGTYARFAVQESPIVDDTLASLLPDVLTYSAQGIDDPSASGRLDITSAGFHGFVISPAGTLFIDPYRQDDTLHYMSYWRRDYARPSGRPPFSCEYHSARSSAPHPRLTTDGIIGRASANAASGTTLRTYRLALAATGEYTVYHGGTVSSAQAAMVTTMNRINAVYEREVAIRMVLVDNTSIVFLDPNTDPFDNTSADLDDNQLAIDAAIGNGNYDIGHLLGTGGGGVAYLESVCWNQYKAYGLTGSPNPIGDAFDIDYVSHEIGHQFGGNHTFNGTTLNCSGGTRSANDAYEPGSGSTIMAYAGICGPEDLQPNSDPYFHGHSFDEIVAYSTNTNPEYGGDCPAETLTNNTPPDVGAGSSLTIPAGTPFYLLQTASDADGDTLTYAWEEFDLGTASPPHTDEGSRPLFRSFTPLSVPWRFFPKLSDVLAGTTTFGETLPTTTRTMSFRMTARDNRAGGGGVNSSMSSVNVVGTAGPFNVTAPSTAVTWNGGSSQTITWDVSNTNSPPVNCGEVKIHLSTDGGNSFPVEILGITPNDGSETVTVPNSATTMGRVRVECVTSPFFNVSHPSFTIVNGLSAPSNVVASPINSTTVRVTWTGVAAATGYEFYRKTAESAYALVATYTLPADLVGSTATLTYDTAQPVGTAALYKMRTISSGSASADSAADVATTVIFADDPRASGTPIRAVHLTELRTAMAALRLLAGLEAFIVTDNVLSGVPVKSVHFTEVRSAIGQARASLLLAAAMYSNSAAVGTVIASTDLEEIRNAMR